MNYRTLGISALVSMISGLAISLLVISSENGYVGGMIILPLLLLIIVVSLILFFMGIIGLTQKKINFGFSFLISALLLPLSFIASCLIAKYFEIGAYRQEPMIPF